MQDPLFNISIDGGTCKTLLDREPDPPQGTGLGAIGNDFWLERRFVPPSEEPDRGVGFCFGLVFGVRAQASGVSPFGSTVGGMGSEPVRAQICRRSSWLTLSARMPNIK